MATRETAQQRQNTKNSTPLSLPPNDSVRFVDSWIGVAAGSASPAFNAFRHLDSRHARQSAGRQPRFLPDARPGDHTKSFGLPRQFRAIPGAEFLLQAIRPDHLGKQSYSGP